MKILAVDDEKLALEALVQAITEADGESTVCASWLPFWVTNLPHL